MTPISKTTRSLLVFISLLSSAAGTADTAAPADANANANVNVNVNVIVAGAGAGEEGSPNSPIPATLQIRGHFRARGQVSDRTDSSLAAQRSMLFLRVRPELSFKASDSSRVVLAPQFAKAAGELSGTAQTSGGLSDSVATFHLGYFEQEIGESARLLVGRQKLSYGDELVLGSFEWNNGARSFDAIRGSYSFFEDSFLDLFYAKLVDNNVNASGNGDADLYGIYSSIRSVPHLDEWDFYGIYLLDAQGSGERPLSLGSLGSRIKTRGRALDTRAEALYQFGKAFGVAQDGYQVDFELGYLLSEEWGLRIALNGLSSSKDYNPLFADPHRWLGMADIFGRRNVTSGLLRLQASPGERLKLQLDTQALARTSSSSTLFGINGTSPVGSIAASESRYAGTEMDLLGTWQASRQVSWTLGASMLLPGPYLRPQLGSERPSFYYAQLEVTY